MADDYSLRQSFSFESWLDKWLAVVTAVIVFTLIIWLMHRWGKYDVYQLTEAVVVAFMGVTATYSFTAVGSRIVLVLKETGQTEGAKWKNKFKNKSYMALNVIVFAVALLLLSLPAAPDLYLLGVFLVFFMFASSNLCQTKALNTLLVGANAEQHVACANPGTALSQAAAAPRQSPPTPPPTQSQDYSGDTGPSWNDPVLSNSGSASTSTRTQRRPVPRQTGALLMEVADWLASENGPSMGCYAVLVVLAAVSMHLGREKPFALFAAGAATFHLSVSVLNFLSGLKGNPLRRAITHVSWREKSVENKSKKVFQDVTDVTSSFIRMWNVGRFISLGVALVAVIYAHWSTFRGLVPH